MTREQIEDIKLSAEEAIKAPWWGPTIFDNDDAPDVFALCELALEALELRAEKERLREALRNHYHVMPVFPKPAKHIVGAEDRYNEVVAIVRAVLEGKE